MARRTLSLEEARKAALAAQGFDRSRPSCRPGVRHIRNVVRRLHLLQLDYVNVLVPAHRLVTFSRIGAHGDDQFHRAVYGGEEFIEHWAHEASLVPVELWPLLSYRRDDYAPYPNSPIMKLRNRKDYLERVIDEVRVNGALTSQDLPPVAGTKRKPGDWHRSVPRSALDYHFGRGNVSVVERLPNFQRVYDLSERIVPTVHFEQRYDREGAQRELLRRAARALGVATLQDLADYFRMSPREALPRVEELVADGTLREVTVETWDRPAFMHRDARIPRKLSASSILSPFDPLVWYRPRAERLFDFDYRIEIYVPAAKRRWGYYVLPYLHGDTIAARVDLKADRLNGVLRVQSSHKEEGVDEDDVADGLAVELRELAAWLGLGEIKVSRRGGFARALSAAVRAL